MIDSGFVRSVRLRQDAPRDGYPWELPAVSALATELPLNPGVTLLTGENGSGKSTVLEALAVACGLNPEGGSRGTLYATRESHSPLGEHLTVVREALRPKTDFFLRAESMFTVGTYLEELREELRGAGGDPLAAYGGKSLHEQSHGESFLAVLVNRFGPNGLYFLDEPEAALSAQNCLTLLRRTHELVDEQSQFVIATHSPIILAYPGATIYECSADGISEIPYDEAPSVKLMRGFLGSPERYLDRLFRDD